GHSRESPAAASGSTRHGRPTPDPDAPCEWDQTYRREGRCDALSSVKCFVIVEPLLRGGDIGLARGQNLPPGGFEQRWNSGAGHAGNAEERQAEFIRSTFHRRGAFFIVERIDLVGAHQLR